jgi:hypothetical protein
VHNCRRTAVINWEANSIIWQSPLGDGGYFDITLRDVWLARLDLDHWMGIPGQRPAAAVGDIASAPLAADPSRFAQGRKGPRTRTRRRDEVRSEIAKAIAALEGSNSWKTTDKERCRLVDRHLNKPGLCTVTSLRRAVADRKPSQGS